MNDPLRVDAQDVERAIGVDFEMWSRAWVVANWSGPREIPEHLEVVAKVIESHAVRNDDRTIGTRANIGRIACSRRAGYRCKKKAKRGYMNQSCTVRGND